MFLSASVSPSAFLPQSPALHAVSLSQGGKKRKRQVNDDCIQALGSESNGEDKSAVVEMREDTGLEAVVRQEISYTDFKLPRYEFYCIDGVVLLKSEY